MTADDSGLPADSPDALAFPPSLAARSGDDGSFPDLFAACLWGVFGLRRGKKRAGLQWLAGGSSRKNGETEACRRKDVNDDRLVFIGDGSGPDGAVGKAARDLRQGRDKTMRAYRIAGNRTSAA